MEHKDNEISRLFFRETKTNRKSPLLSIWTLEREHILAVCSDLINFLRAESYRLNDSVFFKFQVDGREIVRLSLTAFVVECPLQSHHFLKIICAHDVLELPRNYRVETDGFTKALGCLSNLHFHGEESTNWFLRCSHMSCWWHRATVNISICR